MDDDGDDGIRQEVSDDGVSRKRFMCLDGVTTLIVSCSSICFDDDADVADDDGNGLKFKRS